MEYDASTSILHVRANQSIRLTIWDTWGSNRCLLRFLAFRTLKVDMGGRFFPGDLQHLPIETLDLSGCETLVFNHSVDLPLLRRVIIYPGQVDPQTLRDSIHSNTHFEIIEQR